jgi:Ca-activated chloride channel homolog
VRHLKFSQNPLLFFLALSLVPTASVLAQTSDSSTRTISLPVAVLDDRGRPVSGLSKERFSVFEKNVQLEITSFHVFDEPASVAFLFDLSESMPARFKNAAAAAASQFTQESNETNEYLVIGFDKKATVLADFGVDRQRIKAALGTVAQSTPKRNTSLFDACSLAIQKLNMSKYSARVMLLFSDGLDNESSLTFIKLREELKESSTTLYAIGLIEPALVGSSLAAEGQSVLDELASVSGGKAFFPRDAKELQDVLDQISLEIGHRYTIAFNPPSTPPDHKWHAIKIKLSLPSTDEQGRKYPHVNVRSRVGYYSL